MTHGLSLSVESNIATLTFDLEGEKVNKLTGDVLRAFDALLDQLSKESYKALVIKSGKSNIFIAGADINEIKDITDVEEGRKAAAFGQDIFNKLENLSFPTVAVIDGACLGGGCELALACDFRVASDSPKTSIGLPEVGLGILPGFGGTQRMPRLMGIQASLGLILSGKAVDGKKALRLKLVDAMYPQAFLSENVETFVSHICTSKGLKAILLKRKKRSFMTSLLEGTFVGRTILFSKAKQGVIATTKGHYPAPEYALQAVKYGITRSLKRGLKKEAELFSQLVTTSISKNLVDLFFISEALKRYTGVSDEAVVAKPIHKAGVLGAGLMGGGIAWLFSYRSISVRLKDLNWHAIGKGFEAAGAVYKQLVKRRRLSRGAATLKMHQISGTTDYSGFSSTDVVVEAIVENIEVKKTVITELETKVSDTTIIASNTSALSITEMAKVMKKPERFVGMHFFSPVNRMPLVEVIRGEQTSDETVATIVKLSQTLKKTPIVVKNCPGFLVNRILIPYVIEAVYCLQDGGRISQIDRLLEDFGLPIGPLALADEVGLDVGYKVAKILEEGYGSRMTVAASFESIFADESLRGKKSGLGFYKHGHTKEENSTIQKMVGGHAVSPSYSLTALEIIDRLILIMVNEAARCLEEDVVETAQHLDMAMIMGTGFPPFRGGLCKYADQRGIGTIVTRLKDLESTLGERFAPAKLLVDYAEQNKTFY